MTDRRGDRGTTRTVHRPSRDGAARVSFVGVDRDHGRRATRDVVEVIAHRGASGYRPEHTLASYELAIRQGAAVIEPDVVVTADGVLVARHENEISDTTDVAEHPEFADRLTTKIIDGRPVTGWFTEDLTLVELRTLRAIERLPALRPANRAYDGRFPIPTLAEVLDLARRSRTRDGRPVGVAPETKHPTYFRSVGLPLEHRLVDALRRAGLDRRDAPVIIQSFETENLERLRRLTRVRLIQLVDSVGAPYDLVAAGDPRDYADLATSEGLRTVARYADAVGFAKDVMIPRDAEGRLGTPTAAIDDAHRAGLSVVGWTFRRENTFLPLQFRRGTEPGAAGDLAGEISAFVQAGMDGLFTDNPDLGAAAVRRLAARRGDPRRVDRRRVDLGRVDLGRVDLRRAVVGRAAAGRVAGGQLTASGGGFSSCSRPRPGADMSPVPGTPSASP